MDDEGALHVVEALMAGTIILTSVLFLTLTSAPSPSGAITGVDLSRHSVDVLGIAASGAVLDNVADDGDPDIVPTWSSRLEEIVSHGLADETEAAADVAYLEELIDEGNRWQLRLDNGVAPLVVLPYGSGFNAEPRGAKAAERFITPPWDENKAYCEGTLVPPPVPLPTTRAPPAGVSHFYPGGLGPDLSADTTLTSPIPSTVDTYGAQNGPQSGSWIDWWRGNDPDTTSTDYTIPAAAPYGWWIIDEGSGTPECFQVKMRDGTAAVMPAYGVQLVVWPIAG